MDSRGVGPEDQSGMIQYLCEIWHSFRKEVRDFRKNFSWNICIEAMVLRLFLPLNDIVSDFLIAKKSNNTIKDKSINSWVTFFSYYFIACPGIMFLLSNLHMSSVRLGNIQSNCFKIFLLPFILIVLILSLEIIFLQDVGLENPTILQHPHILFPIAVFVSSTILIVGAMHVVLHGSFMQNLSNTAARYEGQFESAPQLTLHMVLLMAGEKYSSRSGLDIYSLLTSLVMLAKDLTENIINVLVDYNPNGLVSKLALMGKFLPVVLMTIIIR